MVLTHYGSYLERRRLSVTLDYINCGKYDKLFIAVAFRIRGLGTRLIDGASIHCIHSQGKSAFDQSAAMRKGFAII